MNWVPTSHQTKTFDANDTSGKNWQWKRQSWQHIWWIEDLDSSIGHRFVIQTFLTHDQTLMYTIGEKDNSTMISTEVASGKGFRWVHEMHAEIVDKLKSFGVTVNGYQMFLKKEEA